MLLYPRRLGVGTLLNVFLAIRQTTIMNQMHQQYTYTETTKPREQRSERMLTRALALVGLVAVLALVVWAGVAAVRSTPAVVSTLQNAAVSLSSVFVPSENETLALDLESTTATSGEPYTISWTHEGIDEVNGTYTLTFGCRGGLSVESPNADGTYRSAFCNTPFNFAGSESAIRIIPTSVENRFLDVPVTVSYFEEGETTATLQDSTVIVVENQEVTDSPSATGRTDGEEGSEEEAEEETPATGGTTSGSNTGNTGGTTGSTTGGSTTGGGYTAGTGTSNTYEIPGSGGTTGGSGGTQIDPNGRPDLTVRILETGYIDEATDAFITANSVLRNQRVAVKFEILNEGTNGTGAWAFSAILPTTPPFVFRSNAQQNLNPGEKIEYTLGFDKVKEGNSVEVKVYADPDERVRETDRADNVKTVVINITQ